MWTECYHQGRAMLVVSQRLRKLAEQNEPAVRASDFLRSICVCTHITQGEDADLAKVADSLAYAGIRGIRD